MRTLFSLPSKSSEQSERAPHFFFGKNGAEKYLVDWELFAASKLYCETEIPSTRSKLAVNRSSSSKRTFKKPLSGMTPQCRIQFCDSVVHPYSTTAKALEVRV